MLREVRLAVFRDTDAELEVAIADDDGTGRVVPLNLIGATLEFFLKARAEDDDGAALYASDAGGITITDPAAGLATVAFTAADIVDSGAYRYHLDSVEAGLRTVRQWGVLVVLDR